jgi:hypothetical protein
VVSLCQREIFARAPGISAHAAACFFADGKSRRIKPFSE